MQDGELTFPISLGDFKILILRRLALKLAKLYIFILVHIFSHAKVTTRFFKKRWMAEIGSTDQLWSQCVLYCWRNFTVRNVAVTSL